MSRSRRAGFGARLAVAAVSVGALLWLSAAPALAVQTRQLLNTFGALKNPQGVAIDQSNGDVYVVDQGNLRIDKFDASGHFLLAFGANVGGSGVNTCTSSCQPGTQGSAPGQFTFNPFDSFVAVDNDPASASHGDVYVGDVGDVKVSKFDSSGNLISSWGAGGQLSGSTSSSFQTIDGITVDSGGDLLVLNDNGTLFKFGQDGSFTTSFGMPRGNFGRGMDSNSAGNLFKVNGDASVEEATSTGSDVGTVTPEQSPQPFTNGLAIDPATGDLYVVTAGKTIDHYAFNGSGQVLEPGGATCAVAPHAGCSPSDSTPISAAGNAVAVASASGDSYVTNPSAGQVYVYGPLVTLPDVATGQASSVGAGGASVGGTVSPDGIAVTDCHFDYGTTNTYGQSVPCAQSPASIGTGSSPVPVSADLTGLSPNTVYHFRLVAANANGTADGSDASLYTTGPPIVDAGAPNSISGSGATLFADVNPRGSDTTYHFEWGTSTAYGNSTPGADAGSGLASQVVSAQISGLQPATSYHFRVDATNSQGTTAGPDLAFTTPAASCPNAAFRTGPSAALPDCRAYEQVSPEDKGGFPARFPVVGSTGDRVFFNSLGLFASGATGSSAYLPYLAQRSTDGWSTREVAPPETSQASGANTEAATPDLSAFVTGVVTQPNSQAPEQALTWWVTRADGSSQPASPTLRPVGGGELDDWVGPVDASTDLSQFVFRAQPLLAAATQSVALYEVVGATSSTPSVRLVDLDNGGNEILDCKPSEILTDSQSQDGSRIVFNDIPQPAGGCSGNGTGGNGSNVWQLYDRVNGQSTIDLSNPQPNDECATTGCQSAAPSDAIFAGASADGSKVFFLSTQRLTDNASEGTGSASAAGINANGCPPPLPSAGFTGTPSDCNLYEYDFNRPAGHNLLDLSAGDTSGGGPQVQYFVSGSADGSRVYFAAKGVLTGQPNRLGQTAQAGALNLYTSDTTTGSVAFIGLLCPFEGQSSGLPGVAQCPTSVGDVPRVNGGDVLQLMPDVTPDGRYLVFNTYAQLTPDDVNQASDVYEYDAQTGSLVRVSVGHDGQDQNGNAGGQDATLNPGPAGFGAAFTGPTQHVVSSDGQTVVFLTARALQAGAVNGQVDGYEWHQGEVTLVTGAQSTNPVAGVAVDPSGQNIVFGTDQGLVAQDTDGLPDIYDARIGGGFATAPTFVPCSGDACQGSPSGAPAPPLAASVGFTGPGDAFSPGVGPGRVRVLSRTVSGSRFAVAVSVSGAGRITITGPGIQSVRWAARHAGSYRLRVALTGAEAMALRHRRKLKLGLHVGFAPAQGQAARINVPVTVKA